MFSIIITAAALLGAVSGQLSAAADGLPPVFPYGSMGAGPDLRSSSRVLSEISAFSVDRHEGNLWRRATTNESSIGLQREESWYWGGDFGASNDTKDAIANLTGVSFDSERYLTQERFSDSLSSVTCDNGTIKFAFNDQEAFDTARQNWDWVNDGSRRIIIILSSGTCNHTARQPYLAKNMTFSGLAAVANARTSSWRDAISHGKFRLNTQGLLSSNDTLQNGTLQKRISVKRDQSIAVGSSFSGKTLFELPMNNTGLTARIDCSDCGTRGSLDLDIDVEFKLGLPKWLGGDGLFQNSGSGQITPSGVGADAVLAFKVDGVIGEELSAAISLPPTPLSGIDVPGVLNIGPVVRVLGQASISQVSAEAALTLGARLDVQPDAIAKVDFSDSSKSQFNGWLPTFTPVGPELSGSVSVSAAVGPRISLELGITIVGGAVGVGAGLSLSAPDLNLNLGASADTAGGVCGDPDAYLGVNLDVGLSAELDAFGGFGDPKDLPNKFPLIATSLPLFSTCQTIGDSTPTSTDATDSTTTDTEPTATTA